MTKSITTKFKDKYMKRRTVNAGEPTEVIVKDIGMIDSSTMGILINVADDSFLVRVSDDNNIDHNKLYNIVHRYSDDKIDNYSVNMVFDSDMEQCGFEKDDYIYRCEYIEDCDDLFNENYELERMINMIGYDRCETERGWKNKISSIYGNDEDSFNVKIRTDVGTELDYKLEVPLSTEPESSEVTKFIEEQGGGQPDLLSDNGECIIVHKSDCTNLDVISYDSSKEWALVVPSTHKKWIDNKGYETGKTNVDTKSKTRNKSGRGKLNTRNASELRYKGRKILVHTFIQSFFLYFAKSFLIDPMLTEEMMRLAFTYIALSMINFAIFILPMYGLVYFMYSRLATSDI